MKEEREAFSKRLADATTKACRDAFGLAAKGKHKAAIRVVCTPFQDHIQVSIECPSEITADKLKARGGLSANAGAKTGTNRQAIPDDDQVNYELNDGRLRLTLIQHDGASSSQPKH